MSRARTESYPGRCVASGAKIILSKLPVGDLATQFFADRNLFCAGRVAQDDMERVAKVWQQIEGGVLGTVGKAGFERGYCLI